MHPRTRLTLAFQLLTVACAPFAPGRPAEALGQATQALGLDGIALLTLQRTVPA
jgi:hypothetical protein